MFGLWFLLWIVNVDGYNPLTIFSRILSSHSRIPDQNYDYNSPISKTMKLYSGMMMEDDSNFFPFDKLEEENALEKSMARELYDELRVGKPGLPVEDFMKWEDIVDVMETGVIDGETMEIIIDEVGVKDGIISFDQFFELVALVNEVTITFENGAQFLDDDTSLEEEESVEDENSEATYKWILDAMTKGKPKKIDTQ